MQAIRKISSLKPTTAKGFFDKIEVYKKPLVFKRSTSSNALSSKRRTSPPAKIVNVQNRRSASSKSVSPKHISSENNGKIVNNSIGKSGNFKPKQVMVLHIPPNAPIERSINNIGKGSAPAKVALVEGDSVTEDGLIGETNAAQVTTLKFDNVKSKKMMLVPLIIYENAQLSTGSNSDNENGDQEASPPIQPSTVPQNDQRDIQDKKDVFLFNLPSDLGPNLEKVPISSMKVDLQMAVPNVEEIVEGYVDLTKGGKSLNNNGDKKIDEKYTTSNVNVLAEFNLGGVENHDESMRNGIIPLDFKAEISGVLGLNIGHINKRKLQELKDVDFNSLITAVTGNIASVAIKKSYEHLDQRMYSTTAGDSNSNLFQTYKLQSKKASQAQNAKMSKGDNKNIKPENAAEQQSTNITKTTPTQNITSTDTTKETIENSNTKKDRPSKVTTETPPVIYPDNSWDQNSNKTDNFTPKELLIHDPSTSTRISGRSEGHINSRGVGEYQGDEAKKDVMHNAMDSTMLTNSSSLSKENDNKGKDCDSKTTDLKAVTSGDSKMLDYDCTPLCKKDDFKLDEHVIDCTMLTNSVSKGTESSQFAGTGEGNKSNDDCNENKGNQFGSNNTDLKAETTEDSKTPICIHKKENSLRDCNEFLTDDIRNELRNYAIECTMLTSTRAGKGGNNKGKGTGPKQIDCSAFKPGGKKGNEKQKSKIDCGSIGKDSEKDTDPKSTTTFAGYGKLLPCSPFTTTKGTGICELFKKPGDGKKDDPKSKIDCSSICGKKPESASGKKDDNKLQSKIQCSTGGKDDKKSGSKVDCSAMCGKKDDKKSGSKIDCSSSGGKKSDSGSGKKDDKKSGSKIDCSAICGKKDEKKSDSKIDCSAICGKKDDKKSDSPCGKKDDNKSKLKIDCSALGGKKDEKKSESKIDCSAICGKKDDKKSDSPRGKKDDNKSKPKIDCSALGGKKDEKKSGSKIDCSAICGKKDEKKSESKIDCSAICGKKDDKKSDSPRGKKDDNKSKLKIDCSALGGKKDEKKSGSKIDCSVICGKKDEKKSESKIDCSAICGKKDDKKSDSPRGKKDDNKSKLKIDCSALGGKKDEKKSGSKIDCSAICGKKDEKKSESKIDCSAICGKKDDKKSDSPCGKKDDNKSKLKIDCSALGGKKDKKKSGSKIDCSAICGKKDEKKSESKIDCSAICGKKDDKKSDSPCGKKDDNKSKPKIDCSALGGKKDEKKSGSKIDCSAICGKKDDKKSESKIDCSAICGKKDDKKSGSKIDCSALCGKKDEKKSGSKIDCSALCGKKDEKKSESKIDCSAICGKKDEKKSGSKIDCSAICGKKDDKKSESKIDCSALCGKKDDKKSGSKIDCSALCGKKDEKKSGSKIDCSALCGKKDDKKSGSKIDCSALRGKKDEKKSGSKIDCSALCGKKDEKKSGSKIDCSALCGKKDEKKSESKIDCSAICGKKDEKKSESKIDCSAICGKKDDKKSDSPCGKKDDNKSRSKIDCSALSKKNKKKSGSKIDCPAMCGKKDEKKSESKIDCSSICGKKDEKKSESKIDCSALCGKKDEKKSESKIDCSAICGKKDDKKSDSPCGKKDDNKSRPKIDCSDLGKKNKKKSGSKIDCSAMCGKKDEKKSESKIDCSSICGKKDEKKSESKIDCSAVAGKKSNCPCGKKDCQCAIQTIKIILGQGMHIEITSAQINQENLKGVQDMLSNKLNSKPDTEKAEKTGLINSIAFDTQEGSNELTIGPITILFDGDTPVVPSKAGAKKLKGDKSDKKVAPFKVGDSKAYSTNSRKCPQITIRATKKRFKITSIRGQTVTEITHPEFVKCIKPNRITIEEPKEPNIQEPCFQSPSCTPCPETGKSIINQIVKVIDCREVCLDSIPVPPVGDYDVLLKVDSVGLSGSDLYMYETGARTDSVVSLGHEASGIVEQVGRCVTNVCVGDRIAVEPGVPCGTCDNCKRGRYNICDDTIFNGSLAQYCVHPSDFCHKLPDQCNLEVGSLVHPLALGLYACNRARVSVKSNVLIIGACPLGLCAVLSAKAMGARHVTIVDVLEKNLEVGSKLGADITILMNEKMTNKDEIECILTKMCRIGQPNVVINCSGCTKSLNTATMCLTPGGICVLAGCATECGYFSILESLMKEISMVSSFRSCNTFPHAIALLENHKNELRNLITHRFFLSNIKQAFETALDEQGAQAVKVIVKCQEENQNPCR